MKRKLFSLIFLFCFLITSQSFACSCFGPMTFCETMSGQMNAFPPDLIVRGVPIKYEYYGMDFLITDRLSGNENRDTIRIWGDNGALCRIYATSFPLGQEFILAVHNCDLGGNYISNPAYPDSLERADDYHISVCGRYFLSVSNDTVYGSIYPNTNSMLYQDFKNDLNNCMTFVSLDEKSFNSLPIFPNPTKGRFSFKTALRGEGVRLLVVDISGREVFRKTIPAHELSERLDVEMEGIQPGLYFVEVRKGKQRQSAKLLIQN